MPPKKPASQTSSQNSTSHSRLLPFITLTLTIIWQSVTFIKIPHLNWSPGFLNTWFAENGLAYYKDFVQPHFIFSHLIMYPFLKLTHWHLETDPILALAIVIATLVSIFLATRRHLSPFGTSAALLFFSLFVWYFSTWIQFSQELLLGLFLLSLPFLLSRFFQVPPSAKTLFCTGVFFSLIELTGQLITPTLIIAFFILIASLLSHQKQPKVILKFLSFFILGASIPVGILSAYSISQNAFSDLFYWNIPYYLIYSKLNASSHTVLPIKDILVFYSPLLPLTLISFRGLKSGFFARNGRSTLCFPSHSHPLSPPLQLSLLSLLLAASTIPSVIFSVFHPHHFLAALPLLALCLGLTLTSLPTASFSVKILTLFTALFLLLFTTTTLLPWHFNKMKPGWHITNLNQITPSSPESAMLNWLNQNSKTDSRINIAADPLFYFLSNRLPANNRFSVLPWHYLPLENTKKIFASSPPQFWLINQDYLNRHRVDWNTPEVADFIKSQLESCYSRTFAEDRWEIWQRICH